MIQQSHSQAYIHQKYNWTRYIHLLCTYICVCARVHRSMGDRLRGWGWGLRLGVGLGLELVQPPGLPEARQGSPKPRPEGQSSGFLEAECGGAHRARGGNPGLQRESVPQPPTPPGGAGAAGAQELGRGAGAKGEGRQRAYSTRYSQVVSHPNTNQARPCLASEIRRDWAFRVVWP